MRRVNITVLNGNKLNKGCVDVRRVYNWNPIYNLIMKIKDDYINTFKDDEKLFENWLIKLNRKEYNDIFESLQVNQDSNILLIRYGLAEMQRGMWEDKNSIYRECRSVVIDLENEAIILAPFRKFFNIDEVEENSLESIYEEIKHADVFEITNKLDGSMQSARYYRDKIFMAGSMAINQNNSWRLKDGYSMLSNNHKKMIKENRNITFIFEYISLKDAHVVLYDKSEEGLYLIGARDVTSGYQWSYDLLSSCAKHYDVKMTNIEKKTIDEVLDEMKTLKSYEKEGWVINIDGHMVKVKCDDYVHLHRLLDKFSSVNVIIENVAEDRIDDMLSKIPEGYRDRILKIANTIIEYKNKTTKLVRDYYDKAPKENKKEFMIWVDKNCPSEVKGCVKNIYLGREFNVLKGRCNNYKKLNDLNIAKDYSELFELLEV